MVKRAGYKVETWEKVGCNSRGRGQVPRGPTALACASSETSPAAPSPGEEILHPLSSPTVSLPHHPFPAGAPADAPK